MKAIITPIGVAMYPRLNAPNTRFERPFYSINLRLNKNDAATKEFQAQLTKILENFKANQEPAKIAGKSTAPIWKPVFDEAGKETAEIELTFKMWADFEDRATGKKVELKPKLVDSKGNPTTVSVGSGSKVRVAFTPSPNVGPNGISLGRRLSAVQIIDLVEYTPDAGFDAVEGGYEVEAVAAPFTDEG